LRFLIVGLGSIGERHVRNLLALGYHDVHVVRRAPAPPRTVSPSSFTTHLDLGEALSVRPHAVVIAAPTAMHVAIALEAVRMGAHVLIEVPLASSLEGVEELRREAEGRRAVVLMGHNLRFHPCLVKMKELVDSGKIGSPIFARAEFGEHLPACHPWEDYRTGYAARRALGGGVVLTSIHEVDFLYWMLGPVVEVAAMTGRLGGLDIDVEDTAAILMRHRNGATSEVHVDFVQPAYSRVCKVVGREAAIRWELRENAVLVCDRNRPAWSKVLDVSDFDFNRTYVDEIRHFIRCIEGTEASINDLRQGIDVLRLGLAALSSSASRSFVDPAGVLNAQD